MLLFLMRLLRSKCACGFRWGNRFGLNGLLVLLGLALTSTFSLAQGAYPDLIQVPSTEVAEDPDDIIIELGSRINFSLIDYVGGNYWEKPLDFPSTLFKPLKGKIKDVYPSNGNWYIKYTPYAFVEGEDQFTYNVVFRDGTENNYTAKLDFLDASREAYLLKDDKSFSIGQILPANLINEFPENQRIAYTFTLFDPEPNFDKVTDYEASNDGATVELIENGSEYFALEQIKRYLENGSSLGLNGVTTNYRIVYKAGVSPPDYELIADPNWNNITIRLREKVDGTEKVTNYPLELNLGNVYEAPQPLLFQIPQIGDNEPKIFKGKEVILEERNAEDSATGAPYIAIHFQVRSEGEDLLGGEKTYNFKYNINFDPNGLNSFVDENNKTVVLNMYDTTQVPPGSDYVPYSPEEVYLYTFDGTDFNMSKISSSPDPGSDLSIIELQRNEYPLYANGETIRLKSAQDYALVIKFADDYFTFPNQPVTFDFTAEDGAASDLLFDLEVSVENDLADPIVREAIPQENEQQLSILKSQSSDSEYFVTFQENHPSNLGLRILNLDSKDADRHPHPEMRLDFNNSTGGFEYGAGIFYELKGPFRNLFKIDQRGVLSFNEMPDYETLFEKNESIFTLSLDLHDSPEDLIEGATDVTANDPSLQVRFEITNGPDLPKLKNPQLQFNAFTEENEEIDLMNFFEKTAVGFLEVDDQDRGNVIKWESSGFSVNGGELTLSRDENVFSYDPPEKFFGTDRFTIFYYDTSDIAVLGEDAAKQSLDFEIVVSNKNDNPKMGFSFNKGQPAKFFKGSVPLTVADYFDQEDNQTLVVEFAENEPISLKLPFNDLLDRQKIVAVEQTGNLDKFTISEPYQDLQYTALEDSEYLWFVDLNWTLPELPDYEVVPGQDKSYSVTLTAIDEFGDYSTFPIRFEITDEDEPPYFSASPASSKIVRQEAKFIVPEEYQGDLLRLTPSDPEGNENVDKWNWRIKDDTLSTDQSRFFMLKYDGNLSSAYTTTTVDDSSLNVVFDPDVLPSYEEIGNDDINVTIIVTGVLEDGEREVGESQILTFKLKDVNDSPKARDGLGRANDGTILLGIDEAKNTDPLPYTRDPGVANSPWVLDNIFEDEDVDENGLPQKLQYEVALSDEYENEEAKRNSLNFQDHMTLIQGRLYFTKHPNFEEIPEGKVMVRVQDPQETFYEILTVKIGDINDPPEVIGEQLPIPEKDISWHEDPADGYYFENLKNNLVRDEDKFAWEQLQFEVVAIVNEGGDLLDPEIVKFIPDDDSGDFDLFFYPPENASGAFTVDYTITDNQFIVPAQLTIFIEEVPDAPIVEIDEEFFTNNPQISKKNYLAQEDSFTFWHNEGQKTIARFNVSDKFDNRAFRKSEFRVQENLQEFAIKEVGSNTYELVWDIPSATNPYGIPFVEDLGKGQSFDLKLTISEEDPDDGTTDYQRTYDVTVYLEEVFDKNPVFLDTQYSVSVPEGEIAVGPFSAIDPDYDKILSFSLDTRLRDSQRFTITDADSANFPSASSFNLNFNGLVTDYDDLFQQKEFELRVIATEDPPGGVVKSTSQDIVIKITNLEEVPFFENNGTTFQTIEGNTETFPVLAGTEDFNKTLSLSLTDIDDADNFHFEYVSSPPGFRFIRAPDYESPEDRGADNLYEVRLKVEGAQKQSMGYGTFFVDVKNQDKAFFIEPENRRDFTCLENTTYVHSFSYFDEESVGQEYPDLFGYSGDMFGFWPNSKKFDGSGDADVDAIFNSEVFVNLGVGFAPRFALPADFNGTGRLDVIVLTENKIAYLKNAGGRNFVEVSLDCFDQAYQDEFTPHFAKFADIDADGLGDLVVSERKVDGGGQTESRIRYFLGTTGGGVFNSAQELKLSHPSSFNRFELADMDQDFDLDLFIPYSGLDQVVWYENRGGADFDPDGVAVLNQIKKPKFVFGFNFENADYFGKSPYANSRDGFKYQELLVGGAESLHLIRYKDGQVQADSEPFLKNVSGAPAIRFLRFADLGGGKPDIIWASNTSTHFILGDENDPLYQSSTVFEFGVDGQPFGLSSMATMVANDGTRLIYFPDQNNNKIRLQEVVVRNDNSPDGPIQFADKDGLEFGAYAGFLAFHDLDLKKDHVEFFINTNSPDYRMFDDSRFRESGMLFFIEEPDFEAPQDFDEDGVYELSIRIEKKPSRNQDATLSFTKAIFIEVKNENEPPELNFFANTGNDGVYHHPEHFPFVGVVNFENPETFSAEEQAVHFSLSGESESFFDINESNGELSFKAIPDFEKPPANNNRYELTVTLDELNSSFSDSIDLIIQVVDGADPPQFHPLGNSNSNGVVDLEGLIPAITYTFEEDNNKIFYLTDLNASDTNEQGNLSTFVISQKPKNGDLFFSINGQTYDGLDANLLAGLEGNFTGVELHYQPNEDFSGNDQAALTCYNDSTYKGHTLSADLAINFRVTPVNDYPSISLPDEVTIPENTSFVQSLKSFAKDPDSEDTPHIAWSIDSTNSNVFKIEDDILKFQSKSLADFERQSKHVVDLIATSGLEGRQLSSSHSLVVQLENEDDAGPESEYLEDFRALGFRVRVAEKSTSLGNLGIIDPDGYGVLSQTLSGNDSSFFTLEADGNLSVSDDYPDGLLFSNPLDQDKNNRYDLVLFLEDSEKNQTYDFSVEIVEPPKFIGLADEYVIGENSKFVASLDAESNSSAPLYFDVIGGLEQALFTVMNGNQLAFKNAPDFERPKDFYQENIYDVEVRVRDGFLEATQAILVYVSDVNDRPTLKTSRYSIEEDGVLAKRFNFVDDENDSVSFPSYTEPEHGTLSIFGLDFLYQPAANFYGSDSFDVNLTDDSKSYRITTVHIEVNGTNDPPVAVEDNSYYYDLSESFPLYINVLANDHSGVDVNGSEDFELVSFTAPSHGNLQRRGNGLFSYTPVGEFLDPTVPFIGVDSFTYTMRDTGGLTANGEVSICIAKHESKPAWTFYKNFGFYYEGANWSKNQSNQWVYLAKNKWIFSEKFGWIYVNNPGNLISASWIWHDQLGWFWTGELYFAWIYSHEFKKWLYLEGKLLDSNSWTLRNEEEEIYNSTDFERVRVRNDVIRILPDLAKLGDYVVSSSFFTRSQILSIISELNRFKRSNTLNQILGFDFQY